MLRLDIRNALQCLIVFISVSLFASNAFSQQTEVVTDTGIGTGPIPGWLVEYYEFRTQGSGRWVADNSAYKSQDEPFDSYATEWTFGVGRKSIKGRLIAIQGRQQTTLVEFRIFWHPELKMAVTQAFSSAGNFAQGELRVIERRSRAMIEHSVHTPGEGDYRELIMENSESGEIRTEDFILAEGIWQPKRKYVWKLSAG